MINEFKIIKLKFISDILTYIPLMFTLFYILCIDFYLGPSWHKTAIQIYTGCFNAITPLILSITVFQTIKFEESIGHFNHILSKTSRLSWALATLMYIYINYVLSLIISTLNLIIMSENLNISLFYLLTSLLFNILITVIIFMIGLFIKNVLAIVGGIFSVIFNIYFGVEVLGDQSWYYMPITYATRYIPMYFQNSVPYVLTLILYVMSLIIICGFLMLTIKKWSGRKIND